MDVLIPCNQLGRDRNTGRSLDLITSQHPNFDTRVPQEFQRALDFILQLILDAGQPKKLEVSLEALSNDRSHGLVPPLELDTRGVVLLLESLIRLFAHLPLSHNERPESFSSHIPSLLL